jgi:hypothetical protein
MGRTVDNQWTDPDEEDREVRRHATHSRGHARTERWVPCAPPRTSLLAPPITERWLRNALPGEVPLRIQGPYSRNPSRLTGLT